MRTVRRYMAALSLVAVVASGSAFAGVRDDGGVGRQMQNASKLRQFIQHVLDYLDSKISIPPT